MPCSFFAYPNGDFNSNNKDYNGLRFRAAFSLTQGLCNPKNDQMEISRINVVPEDNVVSLGFRLTEMAACTKQNSTTAHILLI